MNRAHPTPPTVSLTDRYLPPPTPVVSTTSHQNTSTRQKANPFKQKPLNTVINSNKRKRISPLSNKPATYERPFLFKRRKTIAQSQAHPLSVINPPPASISSHHQSDQTSRKRPRSSSTPPSLNITADRPQAKKRKLLSLNQPTITYPYRFAFTPLDQSTTMVHGDSADTQLKAIPPTDSNALPPQDLSSTSASDGGTDTNVSPYTIPLYASASVSNTSTSSSSIYSSSDDDSTDIDNQLPSQGYHSNLTSSNRFTDVFNFTSNDSLPLIRSNYNINNNKCANTNIHLNSTSSSSSVDDFLTNIDFNLGQDSSSDSSLYVCMYV